MDSLVAVCPTPSPPTRCTSACLAPSPLRCYPQSSSQKRKRRAILCPASFCSSARLRQKTLLSLRSLASNQLTQTSLVRMQVLRTLPPMCGCSCWTQLCSTTWGCPSGWSMTIATGFALGPLSSQQGAQRLCTFVRDASSILGFSTRWTQPRCG